jgi:hypothetical protein
MANYEVTEYRIYKGYCTSCHINYEGKLPNGVSKKGFGPRAHGMASLLTSKYRLSKRLVKLFGFWKTEYQIELALSKKQKRRLRYFKNKMLKWLIIGTYCGHDKTARTCKNILDFSNSLWHFFEIKHVPPTNNHAEQQLRPLVISKKLTFGTQSDRGSRFIERIFTLFMTCKQQSRDILTFLVEAVQKYFLGEKSQFLTMVS